MQNTPNPLEMAAALPELWFPKVIAQFDSYYVKVAKLRGTLAWHKHENEDEVFFVLKGSLIIEYADKSVELKTGDLHVVPKGVMHNPVADEECLVMLMENKTTEHTGDTESAAKRSIEDQLGSFI